MTPSSSPLLPDAPEQAFSRRTCFQLLAGALAAPAMAQNRAGKGAAAPPPPAATTAAPTSTAGRIDKLPLHVLLIGNSSYARNAALRNPERDVQLLEKAFTARGARVRKLLDLSVNQLENVIPSFLASLGPPPFTVWLAYSGHAVQINGRNYLQGIDSDFSNAAKVRGFGLDLDRVQGLLERARPVAAVLSVDACRNNPFEPEMTRGAVEGLAALEPRGMCVSFSTAPYMRALDGESGQNSPYARALADALAGKQSKSLDTILRETANVVYRSTAQRQIPEYRSSLRGEWWFEADAVALRELDASPTTAGPKTEGEARNLTRQVSYRPDEPPQPARYTNTDVEHWMRLEQTINTAVRRTGKSQAAELLARVARSKPSDEERLLASVLLEDGMAGVTRNQLKARQLLQPLATGGNAYAQTLLGESFYSDRVYDQAYKWLSIAVRSGFPRAMTDLSQMEAEGLSGSDPQAAAIRMLDSMMRQSANVIPKPGQPPTPEMQDAANRMKELFGTPKR